MRMPCDILPGAGLLKQPGKAFSPYKNALIELGRMEPKLVVLGADLASSAEIDAFAEEFSERFFNVGCAEQNMVGIAAGLAMEGFIPFAHSFGVFVTRRPYEQVVVQVAMEHQNVKLVGVIPGLTSRLGPTHQAVDDLALMRTLPGMVVVAPADATEVEQMPNLLASFEGPAYARCLRRQVPRYFDPARHRLCLGQATRILEGDDVAIVSTGVMLSHCLEASSLLQDEGLSVSLVHVPFLKPLYAEGILGAVGRARLVVTVENHFTCGGLGSAVAELLAEAGLGARLLRVGLQDRFGEPGTPDYLFHRFGLDADAIFGRIIQALTRKYA